MRHLRLSVVAATSVITLAASSPIYSKVGGSQIAGHASASPLAARADCSRETALRVGRPFFRDPSSGGNPIGQVLCGPFAGPGSEALAVTFNAPTCWSPQRWVIFRFTEGEWRVALDQSAFIFPLAVVGADLRERRPVFRSGDPRCVPSGGSRARIWHWDGTRFTAGPWKQVTPPDPTTSGYFKTPSGNIACDYQTLRPPYVRCGIKSGLKPPPPPKRPGCFRTNRISLGVSGRPRLGASICPGDDEGDAGPFAGKGVAQVLDYGKAWSGGGLRCTSAFKGLTCRNRSGHGFFLSRARWRRF